MASPIVKNLVIGGMDIHLRQNNEKGFYVKECGNLRFFRGHIHNTFPLDDFMTLEPVENVQNFDAELVNTFYYAN